MLPFSLLFSRFRLYARLYARLCDRARPRRDADAVPLATRPGAHRRFQPFAL